MHSAEPTGQQMEIRPDVDGRLAERLREIFPLMDEGLLSREEADRIVNVAADLLELYIMEKGSHLQQKEGRG